MTKKQAYYYLLLIVTTTIWGVGFLAAKFATQTMDPVIVAYFRYAISSLVLLPLMLLTERHHAKPSKVNWMQFFILAITGVILYNICFFIGAKYSTVVKSSLVISSNGPIIAILSGMFLKENLTFFNIFGLVSSLLGAFLIITNGDLTVIFSEWSWVDLVLILASLSWAVFTVLSKYVMKTFSPLVVTTYVSCLGTILLSPLAITHFSIDQIMLASIYEWISIFFIAIFVAVLSNIWWNKSIKEVGAAKASVFINIMPLSATIMAVIFLHEHLTFYHMVGAFLILGGVYVNTWKRSINKIRPLESKSPREMM
jgi:drug/metabolite transporter (DMT)-like permease